LISQECPDEVLIGVSSKDNCETNPLAFVHIVTGSSGSDNGLESSTENENDCSGEMEFEMDDFEVAKEEQTGLNVDESSDEEYEFE
jgi:hypothetical protein